MKTKNVRTICFVMVVLFLCSPYASGTIHFKDGLTHNINYQINDNVWVDYQSPSMYTTVNLLAGASISSPYYFRGYGHSRINVRGGSINGNFYIADSGQVNISGGSIGSNLHSYDSSQVDISGGEIGILLLSDQSKIKIFGCDFAVDGQSVGYGELTSIFGGIWGFEPFRFLTGTLTSNEPINSLFFIGENARIILIPEPASALLMVIGIFALRQRRR